MPQEWRNAGHHLCSARYFAISTRILLSLGQEYTGTVGVVKPAPVDIRLVAEGLLRLSDSCTN